MTTETVENERIAARARMAIAAGFAFVTIQIKVGRFDLVPNLIGALLVLLALPYLALPRWARTWLAVMSVGLAVTEILLLGDAEAWISGLIGGWLADRTPGPADALLPAVSGALRVAPVAFNIGFVLAASGLLVHAAARAGRTAPAAMLVAACAGMFGIAAWALGEGTISMRWSSPAAWLAVAVLPLLLVAGSFACARWLTTREPPPLPRGRFGWAFAAVAVATLAVVAAHEGEAAVARHREATSQKSVASIVWLARHRPELELRPYSLYPVERAEPARLWRRLAELRPREAGVLKNAAAFERFNGHPARAEQYYQALVRLAPGDAEAAYALGYLQLDRAYLAAGDERRQLARSGLANLTAARERASGTNSVWQAATIEAGNAALLLGDFGTVRQLGAELTGHRPGLAASEAKLYGSQLVGLAALAGGDVARAREELLRAAGAVKASPFEFSNAPDLPLAQALLERGERDAVLAFLDLAARERPRWRPAELATAIRRGETPRLVSVRRGELR